MLDFAHYLSDGYRTARGNDSGWSRDPSGLFLPPKPRRYNKPIALDLYAGCGGFSLGFEQAGFQVVGAVEWWPDAAHSYLLNLGSPTTRLYMGKEVFPECGKRQAARWEKVAGQTIPAKDFFPKAGENHLKLQAGGEVGDLTPVEHFWLANVAELKGSDILEALGLEVGDLDAVFGGPPCQGFSIAGARDVTDPRNSGVFEFARLVCELKPKAFAMENVPGILSMTTTEGVPVVDALCRIFEDGGMGSYEALRKMLLSSSGVGAAIKQPKQERADQEPDQGEQMDLFGAVAQ